VGERNRNQSLPVAKGEQEAIMAMPQRDNVIRRRSASYGGQVEEIKRLEPPPRIRFGAPSALLEYAVRPGLRTE